MTNNKTQEDGQSQTKFHWWQAVVFLISTGMLIWSFWLGFSQECLTPERAQLLRIFVSLAGAGYATALTGFLTADFALGQKMAVSGGGSLAVFLVIFALNPATPASSRSCGDGTATVVVIDNIARRYEQEDLTRTNADFIMEFIQEIDADGRFAVQRDLVRAGWEGEDDLVNKHPRLVVIHLTSFFNSTNAVVDHTEFGAAIDELLSLLEYLRTSVPDAYVMVYTRSTPLSGVWPADTHDYVIKRVSEVEAYIADHPKHTSLLELPWNARFKDPQVKRLVKTKLREVLRDL